MKEIKLTQNKVAIVDDKDFEFLNKWKWCCSHGYAVKKSKMSDGSYNQTRMHRLIALPYDGEYTDHINQNKLDNRSENLRTCSKSNNSRNRGKQRNNTSGYKGVVYHGSSKKWRAQIITDNKYRNLGHYVTKREAALAYNAAAIVLHGEFACLNELGGGE